jgi:RES domain-containing protein
MDLQLPRTRPLPNERESRQLGDRWAIEKLSAVLKVPTVVTSEEYNFIINPEHPDFGSVRIVESFAFTLDDRIEKLLQRDRPM